MKITNKKQTSLNDECTLIKLSYAPNENDFDAYEKVKEQEVFCGFFSISQNEHYEAAKEGKRLFCGVIINSVENINPEQVKINKDIYDVERIYQRPDGYTELYLRGK